MFNRLIPIKTISPLHFNNEILLRQHFPHQKVQYVYSFLYLLRAAHEEHGTLGFKYVSSDLIVVLGQRNNRIYVIPVMDRTKGFRLQEFCHDLSLKTQNRIFLKKFSQETYPNMQNIVTQNLTEDELEDDSYPEKMIRLSKLFTLPQGEINPAAKRFKRQVKRFEKLGIYFDIIDELGNIPQQKIVLFLKQTPEKFANYLPIITYLYTQGQDPRYKTMIFIHKGIVQGLYIADTLSQKELGLYCAVNAKNNPGSTEWMDCFFFRKMFFNGIQTIYFGGAETKGVDYYVKKLLPENPSYSVKTVEYFPVIRYNNNMRETHIRLVDKKDLDALATIYAEASNALNIGESWTHKTAYQFIEYLYKVQPDLFFVAEAKGEIVGGIVATIRPWWDGNHLTKGGVFLDSDYQKRGIEKNLIKELFTAAKEKYSVVSWDTYINTVHNDSLAWYKNLGFEESKYSPMLEGNIDKVLSILKEKAND